MAQRNRIITVELTKVAMPICSEFEKTLTLKEIVGAALVVFNRLSDHERANAISIARGLIPADVPA